MKKYYFIVLLSCLFACQKEENYTNIIDLPGTEKDVKLSSLIDTMIYIPLDSSMTLSHIHRIRMDDSLFFINSVRSPLLCFDRNGRLIRSIGNKGSGPGEYKFILGFDLNTEHDVVYMLDTYKIRAYNYHGQYQKEELIQFDEFCSDVSIINNNIFAIQYINYGQAKYNWLEYHSNGTIKSEKLNSVPAFKNDQLGYGNVFKYGDDGYYCNHINDTIFRIGPKGIQPAYCFKRKESDAAANNKSNYPHFYDMVKIKNYLLMSYLMDGEFYTSIYDEHKKQTYLLSKANTMNHAGSGTGIFNDYNYSLNFVPKYYTKCGKDEYLVSWVFPYELMDDKVERPITNQNRREKFMDFIGQLKEDGNPVLILARLKN